MTNAISAGDGTYRVLVTFSQGGESYRVVAELSVMGTKALLSFHPLGRRPEERNPMTKVQLAITRPQLVPLEERLNGVDYILSSPVPLDEAAAKAVFGSTHTRPGGSATDC